MKKRLLIFLAASSCLSAYAQNLSSSIKGKAGISNFFTPVADKKISFSGNNASSLVGLNSKANLVLTKTDKDKLGFVNYRFYQTYNNIPVENSMYVMHTKSGVLKSLSGFIVTDFDPTMVTKRGSVVLDKNSAVQAAMRNVKAQTYAWQVPALEKQIKAQSKDSKATYKPNPQLVWYNPGTQLQPRTLQLCYKVDVYSTKPLSRAYYFINASSGQLVGKKDRIEKTDAVGTAQTYWSGPRTIHSSKVGPNDYILRDSTKGDGVITLHADPGQYGDDYTNNSADWTLPGLDQAALDAHYGVSETWQFYYDELGRNSYDGNGGALYSYVNEDDFDNAYWDGSSMHFFKRSTGEEGGVTGIDVTGHELTHGVTQETSGLNYDFGESGAMNESMSDIFGKFVQFWAKPEDYNWLLSNDMNWIIRDMSDPNAYGQPDTKGGLYWFDFADPHTNSGVGNFMLYLLYNGGSGTNDLGNAYTVNGLGLEKCAAIMYRCQTEYLVPTSQYIDWRIAAIQSASDLYGEDASEVDEVKNAFYAVGVGPSADGCDAPNNLTASNATKTSVVLTWSDIPGIEKYNLEWRPVSSPDWMTISDIEDTTYTLTGLKQGSGYVARVQSICPNGNLSGYSDSLLFYTADKTNYVYCTAYGESTDFEYIDKVTVDGDKAKKSGNNGGYYYFGGVVVNLQKGKTHTYSLKPGFTTEFTYSENWAAFMDFNHDGDFDDEGELIGTTTTEDETPATGTFKIPNSAKETYTRLRIIMEFGSTPTDPCATFTYGEVEDYTVKITAGNPPNTPFAPENLVVSPNPIKNYNAAAALTLAKSGNVIIKVSDLSGRVLLTQNAGSLKSGKNNIPLKGLNALTKGVFLLTAEQSGVVIGRTHLLME